MQIRITVMKVLPKTFETGKEKNKHISQLLRAVELCFQEVYYFDSKNIECSRRAVRIYLPRNIPRIAWKNTIPQTIRLLKTLSVERGGGRRRTGIFTLFLSYIHRMTVNYHQNSTNH